MITQTVDLFGTEDAPASPALVIPPAQTAVAAPLTAAAPVTLADYDVVLVNTSGGKDSMAMLTYLVALAGHQGVGTDNFVAVHCDLGRVEWEGTRELAEDQAAAYGVAFVTVARDEDLLDQVATRRRTLDAKAAALTAEAEALAVAGWTRFADLAAGDATKATDTPAWPSSTARYCTSDQKTSQVAKLMTHIGNVWRAFGNTRPVRILNTLGIRAAESPARAKKPSLHRDTASNTRREVTRWLPIFDWSDAMVWAVIGASRLPVHAAYAAGMPRLSCVFCVLSGERELVIAARLNPALAEAYAETENGCGLEHAGGGRSYVGDVRSRYFTELDGDGGAKAYANGWAARLVAQGYRLSR